MSQMTNGNKLYGVVEITKQNTTVTLNTEGHYIEKDIELSVGISDSNFVPSNIKIGTTILGVSGTGLADVLLEQDNDGDVIIPSNVLANAYTIQNSTIIPAASTQVLNPSSGYLFSSVTVLGDENLIPSNIANGVSIFGVVGTFNGN